MSISYIESLFCSSLLDITLKFIAIFVWLLKYEEFIFLYIIIDKFMI